MTSSASLQIQIWPIDRLVFCARNSRKNDAAVDRMCSSIREFGFKIPVLARSDGEVVDGHLRLKAARKLGIAEMPVILCDEWTPQQSRDLRIYSGSTVRYRCCRDDPAENRTRGQSRRDATETVRVLARLRDPNLLVVETAIATGARISEILGLTWQLVDLERGVISVVQRNWRGDIDDPKSRTSKRPLTLGYLVDRYRVKVASDRPKPNSWVFGRTDGSGLPLWGSGVRQALKRAAAAEGCDFPGLGPHSFRRANITWCQEVGGSSIEPSKIAGHSTLRMTEEYTKIQLPRQEELTRRIQERLASVGEKQSVAMQ